MSNLHKKEQFNLIIKTQSDIIKKIVNKNEMSCRICMEVNCEMIHLFNEANRDIINKIEFCTGVLIKNENNYSSHICMVCLQNLTVAYDFKNLCLNSREKQLNGVFLNNKSKNHNNNDADNTSHADLMSNENELSSSHEDTKKKDFDIKIVKRKRLSFVLDQRECKSSIEIKRDGSTRLIEIKLDKKLDLDKWVCEICGKNFTHRQSLYSHARSHRPPRLACAHCDYRTASKHDLEKHMSIHNGDKRYACGCGAQFRTASNRARHSRRHGGRALRCPAPGCRRSFYDAPDLKRHLRTHDHVKRYSCDVCQAVFKKRCSWKAHVQKQHGVRVPPQRRGRRKENIVLSDAEPALI